MHNVYQILDGCAKVSAHSLHTKGYTERMHTESSIVSTSKAFNSANRLVA